MGFPSNIYIEDKKYSSIQTPILPDGYEIYKVKSWSDPYMQSIGYTAFGRGNVGQFMVVSPYIFNAQMEWCGALSSNTNFSRMNRSDAFNLANHQLLDFGYKWGLSEKEIISLLNVPLRDGYTLKQKMGYLIWSTNTWGAQMRSNGEWWDYLRDASGNYLLDADGRKREVEIQMIAIVHGGQKILASTETRFIMGKSMRRMINFRRSDWGKHYDKYPYLMQRVTVASTPNNVYGEYPKGHVYCPVALDPRDFKFYTSRFIPDSYWLPDAQMTKV